MASIDSKSNIKYIGMDSGQFNSDVEREPGTSVETILVTTDSYEEFEQEMSSSLEECNMKESMMSTISEIQEEIQDLSIKEDIKSPEEPNLPCINDEAANVQNNINDDYWHNDEWLAKEKHVFILSSAGKPIYSRYGNEDKLVTIFGVMQALVSFVQIENDFIRSIHAGNMKFIFLAKGPLILVSVSRTTESVPYVILQLTNVFNQICSVLTLTHLNRIYEQRRNYDLRRLLSGSERLIDHLLNFMETEPAFMLGAIKCLPLMSSIRDSITQTISQACSKVKNLVFAILIAQNQLITLVRMKKYIIHPSDLHLIFNLVNSSESFKAAECWTPICLPKFDASGFLHGHVSYLSDDCQACLLLLTVDRDVFFVLSEVKQKIVEKLRRSNWLEPINDALNKRGNTTSALGVPEVRHFLYKSKSTAQFYSSELQPPYTLESEKKRLHAIYLSLYSKMHCSARPLKLIYQQLEKETVFGWLTSGYEMYIIFEPLVDKQSAIIAVNKLLKWIKKEDDRIFILNAPTF